MLVDLVKKSFSIDLRSLALWRIGLGSLLFIDLIIRGLDLAAHYTDMGVIPRAFLIGRQAHSWFLSLHFMSGRIEFQAFLFILHGLFALCLIFGLRSRLAAFLSWCLLVSLQVRNPEVQDASDHIIRMGLFFAMFLPIGARYSLDAHFNPPKEHKESVFSVASIAITLQVLFIYVFAIVTRTGPQWWDGSALYMAFHLDQLISSTGLMLRQFPEVLKIGTYGTMLVEVLGPILLLMPVWQTYTRMLALMLLWGLHLGIATFMALGTFPYISIAILFIFIPASWWEWLQQKYPWAKQNPFALESFSFLRQKLRTLAGTNNEYKTHRFWQCFCAVAIIWITNYNIHQHTKIDILPKSLFSMGYTLRWNQGWALFSPFPRTDDGWYVIPATLKNKSQVNLFDEGKPVTWDKPEVVSATYKNQRWQSYMMKLMKKKKEDYRRHFGKYLCREWNAKHQGELRLDTFEIYFMKERTLAKRIAEPKKKLLWQHNCNAKSRNKLKPQRSAK